MRYFITVEDKPYPPTRLIETEWAHFANNRAYFCPQCGRLWAKWEKENNDPLSYTGQWFAVHRSCPNHQWGWWNGDRPGSLILDGADAVVLPSSLLIREVTLSTATPVAEETDDSPISEDTQ